jgi:hypothetical protein
MRDNYLAFLAEGDKEGRSVLHSGGIGREEQH